MPRVFQGPAGLGARLVALALALAAICGHAGVSRAAEPVGAPDRDALRPADLSADVPRGEVAIAGDLSDGTARHLRALLRAHPGLRVVSFASDGGLVDEADQIGDIVAANGLVTLVRGTCASACTLAYVRGRERLAESGARLGFHAPWVPGEGREQVPSEEERLAYVSAGIPADFVAEALAVPAASIWFPDAARLLAARVVTAVLPADQLASKLAALAPARKLAAAE